MGRVVRRVPLDFDWPLGKTWDGFLLPDRLVYPRCRVCGPPTEDGGYGGLGDGLTPAARAVANTFYPHQIGGFGSSQDPHVKALAWHDKLGQAEVDELVNQGRLRQLVADPASPNESRWVSVPRTAAEVNEANGDERSMMGRLVHDGINRSILVQFRCQTLGIEMACPACGGDGMDATPEQRREREEWEPEKLPDGEGWQVWENVSEGSPVSPVLPTHEAFIGWLTQDHPEAPGGWGWKAMTRLGAEEFAQEGFAFSAVASPEGGVEDGVSFVDRLAWGVGR